jgi:histidyl-tRNA synthetase
MCNNHFKAVLELVEDSNLIYEADPYLVRGLDYYSRTVFEVVPHASSLALGGGGRYDYLAEALGGRFIPGVGVAFGIERIIEAMRLAGIALHPKTRPKVFFIAVGEQAKKASLRSMGTLRAAGITVVEALGKKSLKAQLKAADRARSELALIVGQREVFEGTVIVRDMNSGAQETIILTNLVDQVKRRFHNHSKA